MKISIKCLSRKIIPTANFTRYLESQKRCIKFKQGKFDEFYELNKKLINNNREGYDK